MTRARPLLDLARAAALLLALIAIGFKGMLPLGYMLAAGEESAAVVLCSSQGMIIAPASDDAPQAPKAASELCAFAAAPAAAPTPAPLAPPAPPAISIDAAPSLPQARGIIFLTGPPLPARGPPLQA